MHRPHEPAGLQAFQAAFGARLRDPQGAPLPAGVPGSRMGVYEGLVFNNLIGFIDACFPVTRSLLGEAAWQAAVRRYLAEHYAVSPLFRDIPGEFLGWASGRLSGLFPEKPFLAELMHYEWLELAVEVAPDDTPAEAIDADGDLLDGEPVWSGATRIACYRFPVHLIGPAYQPEEPGPAPSCYLLYRDAGDRVRFSLLTPPSARLAEWLQEGGVTGREALERIAAAGGQPLSAALLQAGHAQLGSFRALGVIRGTRRAA